MYLPNHFLITYVRSQFCAFLVLGLLNTSILLCMAELYSFPNSWWFFLSVGLIHSSNAIMDFDGHFGSSRTEQDHHHCLLVVAAVWRNLVNLFFLLILTASNMSYWQIIRSTLTRISIHTGPGQGISLFPRVCLPIS